LHAPNYRPLLLRVGLVLGVAGLLAGCGASLDSQFGAGLAQDTEAGKAAPEKVAETTPVGAAETKPVRKINGTAAKAAGASGSVEDFKAVGNAAIQGSTPGNSAYKIGPLDVLDVTVFKVKDLESHVQVAESGTINLPLVGEVPAAGRTAQEIERDLEKRLGAKYLKNPQVTIYVKEYNSQRLTVEGAVKKPGVYPLKGKTTLLQAIAMAEGQNTDLASSNVVVFRKTDGQRTAARFDVDEIRAGTTEDPTMRQGDVVVVETSTGKVAFNNVVKVIPIATLFRPF
jgi:polysaccharide export outer membrane protein